MMPWLPFLAYQAANLRDDVFNAVAPSRHFAHAHHWGIKAALAELPMSSNPYRTPKDRAAWVAGYKHASEPALLIHR